MTRHTTDPSSSKLGQAVRLIVCGCTARTALPVAAIVGTILSAINEGSLLVSGRPNTATWVRISLNYVVPYLVASIGYLAALRRTD